MTSPSTDSLKLIPSWKEALGGEFQKPYIQNLREFLRSEYLKKKIIYPATNEYFGALNSTPLEEVKVVILGQDPYHGPGQAHGLCFSVKRGVPPPPSLQNIFKELNDDLNIPIPDHGCLENWAKQGILLLNSVLTVEKGRAASHKDKGWEQLTDKIIETLHNQERPICFVLWGKYAQDKMKYLNNSKRQHLILRSTHPSPLSAYNGFMGSGHFSKISDFVKQNYGIEIDWNLT